jgi:transposase
MSKKTFTKSQMEELQKNPNVVGVTKTGITYHPDFKVKAVMEYLNGKSPKEIFVEQGFDLGIIGVELPRKRLYQWREIYIEIGESGLLTDNRGKGTKPSSKEIPLEEKLRRAEAKIKFLEVENDFLKKLEALERQALKRNRN